MTRNVFAFIAPQENVPVRPPVHIPDPEVDMNIVFVKAPEPQEPAAPLVVPPAQQKTLIYVLNKNPTLEQEVIEIPANDGEEPEVFFINYTPGENPILPGGIDLQTALSQAPQSGLGGQGYSAPVQRYAAPTRGYSAPTQGYSAPNVRDYSDIQHEYSAPVTGYEAPPGFIKQLQSQQVNSRAGYQTYVAPQQQSYNQLNVDYKQPESESRETYKRLSLEYHRPQQSFYRRPTEGYVSAKPVILDQFNRGSADSSSPLVIQQLSAETVNAYQRYNAPVSAESVEIIQYHAPVPSTGYSAEQRKTTANIRAIKSSQVYGSSDHADDSQSTLVPIRLTAVKLQGDLSGGSSKGGGYKSRFEQEASSHFPGIANLFTGL